MSPGSSQAEICFGRDFWVKAVNRCVQRGLSPSRRRILCNQPFSSTLISIFNSDRIRRAAESSFLSVLSCMGLAEWSLGSVSGSSLKGHQFRFSAVVPACATMTKSKQSVRWPMTMRTSAVIRAATDEGEEWKRYSDGLGPAVRASYQVSEPDSVIALSESCPRYMNWVSRACR